MPLFILSFFDVGISLFFNAPSASRFRQTRLRNVNNTKSSTHQPPLESDLRPVRRRHGPPDEAHGITHLVGILADL